VIELDTDDSTFGDETKSCSGGARYAGVEVEIVESH
jgi:hypothetical protein